MRHLSSLGAIVDSTLSAYPKGRAKLPCALLMPRETISPLGLGSIVPLHCLGVDHDLWDSAVAAREHFNSRVTTRFTAPTLVPQWPHSIADLSEAGAILCDHANIAEIALGGLIVQHFAAQSSQSHRPSDPDRRYPHYMMKCEACGERDEPREPAVWPRCFPTCSRSKLALRLTRRLLRSNVSPAGGGQSARGRRFARPYDRDSRAALARQVCSGELGLGDLLEHAPLGLDADKNERYRGDQIGQREGIKCIGADTVREHKPDHRGHQKRANAANAEEPTNRRRPDTVGCNSLT